MGQVYFALFRDSLNKNPMAVKLLIADNQVLFIEGLKAVLKRHQPEWEVHVATGLDEFSKQLEKRPDLVLLNPALLSREHQSQIKGRLQRNRFLVWSASDDAIQVQNALSLGALGFITKSCGETTIMEAIYATLDGQRYYCTGLKAPASSPTFHKEEAASEWHTLTDREQEVVIMLGKGYGNQGIADSLFISLYTVRTHRKNAMKKLGLRSISELVRFTVSTGLIKS